MGDQRDRGRNNTHDTGSAAARPRDDLQTASKKKTGEQRNDDKDKVDRENEPADGEKDTK